ncbi:hypothetical protein JL721_8722 [Aureococcus anophagefferens]|nr:hypothetical protein JL721_8722 [Aureococcus anophagefferens]
MPQPQRGSYLEMREERKSEDGARSPPTNPAWSAPPPPPPPAAWGRSVDVVFRKRKLGLDLRFDPRAAAVLAEAPDHRAQLRAGDALLALDGEAVVIDSEEAFQALFFRLADGPRPLRLTFTRRAPQRSRVASVAGVDYEAPAFYELDVAGGRLQGKDGKDAAEGLPGCEAGDSFLGLDGALALRADARRLGALDAAAGSQAPKAAFCRGSAGDALYTVKLPAAEIEDDDDWDDHPAAAGPAACRRPPTRTASWSGLSASEKRRLAQLRRLLRAGVGAEWHQTVGDGACRRRPVLLREFGDFEGFAVEPLRSKPIVVLFDALASVEMPFNSRYGVDDATLAASFTVTFGPRGRRPRSAVSLSVDEGRSSLPARESASGAAAALSAVGRSAPFFLMDGDAPQRRWWQNLRKGVVVEVYYAEDTYAVKTPVGDVDVAETAFSEGTYCRCVVVRRMRAGRAEGKHWYVLKYKDGPYDCDAPRGAKRRGLPKGTRFVGVPRDCMVLTYENQKLYLPWMLALITLAQILFFVQFADQRYGAREVGPSGPTFGVALGALTCAFTDIHRAVVGASGGVYTLIGLHFADVLLNFRAMNDHARRATRALLCTAVPALDIFIYVFLYADDTTSYSAHAGGGAAGFLLGLALLDPVAEMKLHTYGVRPLAALALLAYFLFAFGWQQSSAAPGRLTALSLEHPSRRRPAALGGLV